MSGADASGDPAPFVSTGRLPDPEAVEAALAEAHERFAGVHDGRVSAAYAELAEMPPGLFGISVVGATGNEYAVGDSDREFTIMSVSKAFVFALICTEFGTERARELVGVNPTGLAFDSVEAIAASPDGRTNPMVNGGAIAAASLAPGDSLEQRWDFLHDGLSRFAGRRLELHEGVCEAALATNERNREIARELAGRERIHCDPDQAVELYSRQCCLLTSARDLAVMGATLSGGGVNPLTGEQVIDTAVCHHALAAMLAAGMYESSGDWLYDVGLPAKSGIGGGIVTVSPGKGGMGTFSPPLDPGGNSVRGALAARYLSSRLGLDLLGSAPQA